MIWQELIGRESSPIPLKIKLEEVRRFAEAIGVSYDGRVPVTFIGTLIETNIPGVVLPIPGMIHGEQKITYHRPLNVEESLNYKKCIKDVYERNSKLGRMVFVVVETIGHDLSGELVFSSSSVLIAPAREDGQ